MSIGSIFLSSVSNVENGVDDGLFALARYKARALLTAKSPTSSIVFGFSKIIRSLIV